MMTFDHTQGSITRAIGVSQERENAIDRAIVESYNNEQPTSVSRHYEAVLRLIAPCTESEYVYIGMAMTVLLHERRAVLKKIMSQLKRQHKATVS